MENSLIEELKSEVKISDILLDYGVSKIIKRGQQYTCSCPFHKDSKPSFNFNERRSVFNCYSCNETGTSVYLVQKLHGLSFPEALRYMAKLSGNYYKYFSK